MWRLAGILTVIVLVGAGASGIGMAAERAPAGQRVRIGTYDNRAIAVAFAHSQHNNVSQKMAEYAAAKREGDTAKMKELEAWGQTQQTKLHMQGFGRAIVADLLEPVQGQLADVARAHDVVAIVPMCDFAGSEVEVVDVTDALVALYEPGARVLESVRALREQPPIDVTTLLQHR